jgi:hypothetical protein
MNMQLEYNEIDNYNPRAQARLAKYSELMWKTKLDSEMNEENMFEWIFKKVENIN